MNGSNIIILSSNGNIHEFCCIKIVPNDLNIVQLICCNSMHSFILVTMAVSVMNHHKPEIKLMTIFFC